MKMEWAWERLPEPREDLVYTRRPQCTREGLCAPEKSLVHMGRCLLRMVHILCTRSWTFPDYSGSTEKGDRVTTVSESL